MSSINTTYFKLYSLCLLILALMVASCDDKVEFTRTYTVFEPVYTSPAEIRSLFAVEATPRVLNEPGKIYMYGDYLFINEPGEGIHVINNADKSNPVNIKFIKLPGNYDIAAKDGALYADSYMDLVVLDIRDINNINVSSRAENIFVNAMNTGMYHPEKGIVTDWIEKEKIEVSSDEFGGIFPHYYAYGGVSSFAALDRSSLQQAFAPAAGSPGVGGSMARFTITGDYLYTIDNNALYTFNIQNPATPTRGTTTQVGWGIETVFPSNGNLFIGAQNGLYIYSLANPRAPRMLSLFTHVVSCDPVVVNGELAYVTLRGGTTCRGVVNQLDIINIKNPEAPELLVSYPMTSPYGLGYDNGLLFICEGQQGLKVFDATDTYKVGERLLTHKSDIDAYDVIPYEGVLILIGRDGLFQFDYSDPSNLKQLSRLTIERTKPIN